MAALTTDLTEVEADSSRVAAEVSRTGKPVIVLKSYEPWVIPQSANNLTETQMRPRNAAGASAFRRGVNPICCQKTRECVFLSLRRAMRESLLRIYPDRNA